MAQRLYYHLEMAKHIEPSMNRYIILDTETTGTNPKTDRVIDIAALEMIDGKLTGNNYQTYLFSGTPSNPGALKIHGLTEAFLNDKPLFEEIVDEFLDFVDGAILIIHNARFDIDMLNSELSHIQREPLQNAVIDTLTMARLTFPRQPVSLDALCTRFNIDTSAREKHGATIDCQLLYQVYCKLTE